MRRIVIAIVAGVIVLISAVGLLTYVSGADSRATEKLTPKKVLVAKVDIPSGTSAAAARVMTELRDIPASAVVNGALTSADQIKDGQTALTAIKAGEQILPSRFGSDKDTSAAGKLQIPKGSQLISFVTTIDRMNGGKVAKGDVIGIFVTADVTVKSAAPRTSPSATPSQTSEKQTVTKMVLSQAPVVDVVGAVSAVPSSAEPSASKNSSQEKIMITVAISNSVDAERLVWGLENGKVYMSLQTKDTDVAVPVFPIMAEDVLNSEAPKK